MMNGRISKPQTTNLMQTSVVVTKLKELVDGWAGSDTKKPTTKAVNKAKRILTILETSKMPWPSVNPVANGGVVLFWKSLTRDVILAIDWDGSANFVTSMKNVDKDTAEVMDKIEAEGSILDIRAIDHMMVWYCTDVAAQA